MLFLILETYVSNGELRNSDLSWLETDGMRANLAADSGRHEGQLSNQVETLSYARKDYKNDLYDEWVELEKNKDNPLGQGRVDYR